MSKSVYFLEIFRHNKFIMKLKCIASIVAFLAAFSLSVLLIGIPKTNFRSAHQCNLQPRQTAASLLEQDINFGNMRDAQTRSLYLSIGSPYLTYTSNEYSEIVTEYVRKSENMNDSALPKDFRIAWRSHMKAWREHANLLEAAQQSFVTENSQSEFIENFKSQNQEITDTWRRVEFFGRKYGVNHVQY